MHFTIIFICINDKESESEVAQPCQTLCDPMVCSLRGSSIPWDFPGKNTGVGCHFLLQGIFPTQGLNPDLPHCRQMLYTLSHQGSCINDYTSLSGEFLKLILIFRTAFYFHKKKKIEKIDDSTESSCVSSTQILLLEKKMVTHSSILASKIPWTEEP